MKNNNQEKIKISDLFTGKVKIERNGEIIKTITCDKNKLIRKQG